MAGASFSLAPAELPDDRVAFERAGHSDTARTPPSRDENGQTVAPPLRVLVVDYEVPFSNDAPLEHEVLWDLFHDAARRHGAVSTPFDGIYEAPRAVGELLSGHGVRLAKLRDATRAELLSMACVTFVALYGDHAAIHERELLKHGFAGGHEPDPWDFW